MQDTLKSTHINIEPHIVVTVNLCIYSMTKIVTATHETTYI